MTLPLIPTPSCCGTAGWAPCPTDGSHNHDDLYYRKAESDCNSVAAFGEIIGTPDPSLCVDCDVLAGVAISTDPMADPILEITEYTDPGSVPYAAPAVTALTVAGDKVSVEWGPNNNDASIPLQLIADAIAANSQAAALMRIAVCDCSSFSSFTSGEIELLPSVEEAPIDGNSYARVDGTWVSISDKAMMSTNSTDVVANTAIPTSFPLQEADLFLGGTSEQSGQILLEKAGTYRVTVHALARLTSANPGDFAIGLVTTDSGGDDVWPGGFFPVLSGESYQSNIDQIIVIPENNTLIGASFVAVAGGNYTFDRYSIYVEKLA